MKLQPWTTRGGISWKFIESIWVDNFYDQVELSSKLIVEFFNKVESGYDISKSQASF